MNWMVFVEYIRNQLIEILCNVFKSKKQKKKILSFKGLFLYQFV